VLKTAAKRYFMAIPLLAVLLMPAIAAAGQNGPATASPIIKKAAGKWIPYDLRIKGSPAALEITAKGVVKMFVLNNVPPFNEKPYSEWLLKKTGADTAAVKSPGGDTMKLSLEKAAGEIFLHAAFKDSSFFMYRPRGDMKKTGFTGRWNMPSFPIFELKEDGTAFFPVLPLPKYADRGRLKEISGGRIAVIVPDKSGVDTVLMVFKPSADFNMMKFVLDKSAYKEAGPAADIPTKKDIDLDIFVVVRGPSGDFFYAQPLVVQQAANLRNAAAQADYMNCRAYLENLRIAEEQYMIDKNEYAYDPELLDTYVGGCLDDDDSCKGKTVQQADASCAPGTLSISKTVLNGFDSYRITGKSKGDPGCNICLTSEATYPPRLDGCPNDEMKCRE